MEDRCICCGEVIPEGRQVCPVCEDGIFFRPYDKEATYTNAFVTYGMNNQCVVAIEELSECQKEICKFLRGDGDIKHLAEEVADATIMLEQIRMIFGIEDLVEQFKMQKIKRLDERLKKGLKK